MRLTLLVVIALAAVGVAVLVRHALSSPPAPSQSRPMTNHQRETFSVTYKVEIDADDPATAHVEWELTGIDEIERLRLKFDPTRFDGFEGSGTIERRRGEVVWRPGGPYARLRYRAKLVHRRAPNKGFDSFAGSDWVLSRTSSLFPRTSVLFRTSIEPSPKSRARLVFRLPPGWQAVTAMEDDGASGFIVEGSGRMDHPRGWLMLGQFERVDAAVAGTAVTVASQGEMTVPASDVLALMEQALPLMTKLVARTLPRLLIVRAPDPMWRGGLSGEESFFMHADRPLRTPDRTSPYLHELFHVLVPFRPGEDAHWVTEGLAEFYSLELQRRIGRIGPSDVARALHLFARYGAWDVDFTRTGGGHVNNKSAPLVMYVLDGRIRAATEGAHGLDDVVGLLAREGGVVSTARFLGAVERVAGKSFTTFFRDHVYRGEQPDVHLPSPVP